MPRGWTRGAKKRFPPSFVFEIHVKEQRQFMYKSSMKMNITYIMLSMLGRNTARKTSQYFLSSEGAKVLSTPTGLRLLFSTIFIYFWISPFVLKIPSTSQPVSPPILGFNRHKIMLNCSHPIKWDICDFFPANLVLAYLITRYQNI